MDICLRASEAQTAYTILRTLSQCSIAQVASFNLRLASSNVWPRQPHPTSDREDPLQLRLVNPKNVRFMPSFLLARLWSA